MNRVKKMLINSESLHPFADGIKNIIFNERRNCNILWVGKTQMRKSTGAITLAKEISKRFDIKKHMVIIEVKPFLDMMKNIKFFRGDVAIGDDFGIGMNHREWYRFLHRALNFSLMTHGFKGIVVLVTVPYEKYIDSDTRMLFDYEVTSLSKNDRERYVKVKIEELQHREIQGKTKTYKHFLRRRFPDGTIKMVRSFKIDYPPKEILDEYFKMAKIAKDKLHFDLHAEAESIERTKAGRTFSFENCAEEIMQNLPKFRKVWQGRELCDLYIIKNEFHVGINRAKQIAAFVEKRIKEVGVDNSKIQPAS